MSVHQLKTTEGWFKRIISGEKTAEIRLHDRDFQVGDLLDLIEIWESNGEHIEPEDGETHWHTAGKPTGRCATVRVTHVLPASHFMGLATGYCLLSIRLVEA